MTRWQWHWGILDGNECCSHRSCLINSCYDYSQHHYQIGRGSPTSLHQHCAHRPWHSPLRTNRAVIAEEICTWWRHQMETFSALLAICARNSPVPGEFPAQRPVTRSFDVCFYLRLNKRLSKQSRGWWFETQSRPLWRHSNVLGRTKAGIQQSVIKGK